MNNSEEIRQDKRYSISEYLKDELRNIYIEIMIDKPVRADITDISMNGLGFEIKKFNEDDRKQIEKTGNFFINIHVAGEKILIDSKKTWGAVVKVKEDNVYRGGLMYKMVSPGDRLILLKFLEKMRIRS